MGQVLLWLRAFWKLGLFNAGVVFLYRMRIRNGHFVRRMPISDYGFSSEAVLVPEHVVNADSPAEYNIVYFNAHEFRCTSPPNWTFDPFSNTSLLANDQHWSQIPDFGLPSGDVKILWELSRFEWLIKSCWKQIHEPDSVSIPTNQWLIDWCVHNPINCGVNWKCAQEASIRAMHLVLSWLIHSKQPDNPDVLRFLQLHVQRIIPTISYARAQDNNHGTSEAVAMFVLGIMLQYGDDAECERYGKFAENIGRKLLENRVKHLIDRDGTFSQYSVNYHRMMLDTLSFAECIRRRYKREVFSTKFYSQADLAARWLHNVIDPVSGDAPNIGANDGAVLFNCDSNQFRDFRPSVQLAMRLFCAQAVYCLCEHSLSKLFNAEIEQESFPLPPIRTIPAKTIFKRVGAGDTFAILKCPVNRFRPLQADALHLDIWHNGANIVRDAGTYSYNPPIEFLDDFTSTSNHSTVEINKRDQMPRLGRFLFGEWLDSCVYESDMEDLISSGYKDWCGGIHSRTVTFCPKNLTVVDRVEGNCQYATLRWRLCPADWQLEGNWLTSESARITWDADRQLEIVLSEGVESRCYLELLPITILEVRAYGPVTFKTQITLP